MKTALKQLIWLVLIMTSISLKAGSATIATRQVILDQSYAIIAPLLDHSSYKGQHGRIGIVGGSEQYTGAPYYAGASALRTGADLATVFCAEAAAIPIKSYSPGKLNLKL